MNCPNCDRELKLVKRLISESEDRIKTYTYQWWKCRTCKRHFFGEFTEYIFDGSYEHSFYNADPDIWKKDLKILKKDPDSMDFLSHYTDRIDYSYEK